MFQCDVVYSFGLSVVILNKNQWQCVVKAHGSSVAVPSNAMLFMQQNEALKRWHRVWFSHLYKRIKTDNAQICYVISLKLFTILPQEYSINIVILLKDHRAFGRNLTESNG